jgi:hypothetical protein
MRSRKHLLVLAVVCVLVAGCRGERTAVAPRPGAHARPLLYPAKLRDVPEGLRPVVGRLLDPAQPTVAAADARPAGVFARVASRKYIIEGGGLKGGGTLGGRPFVFVTPPETLYGRSLLQVFSAIGYAADEVLTGQLGEEKVAVVFRWGDVVATHPGRDGKLPDAWADAVYPATWENLTALVERMAADPKWHALDDAGGPPTPMRLRLRSERERQFVLGFPESGLRRVRSTPYTALRDVGGADWEYRQVLERAMSASEHYTGDGTSRPTINGGGRRPAGFPEFLGPNRPLAELPEVAVIGLGAIKVGE